MRSRKWIGLEAVGLSSRVATRMSLFSMAPGGGLLGCGALGRRAPDGDGGGLLWGDAPPWAALRVGLAPAGAEVGSAWGMI
jgi:hypothetical protein